MRAFVLVLVVLGVFLISQCAQFFGHKYSSEFWLEVASVGFTLAGMLTFLAGGLGLWILKVRVTAHQKTDQPEQWLMQVYDNIPAAVFVMQDQEVIYSNPVFQTLQQRFNNDNPFSLVTQSQQDIWLTTENGERFAFWVKQFSLSKIKGQAYIVTDITSVKLQGSFIQKVAKDLNSLSKNSMNSVMKLIHEFVPSSVLYVGEYNNNTGCYTYLTHEGEADHLIYEDIKLNDGCFIDNDWTWFDTSSEKSSSAPSLVSLQDMTFYGGVLLSDESSSTLGVIMLMQKSKIAVSELLLDFLSIFSIRVRSELEHRQDKRKVELSNHRYRTFIESSNEAIADIILQPSIYVDENVSDQWKGIKENASLKEVNPAFSHLFGLSHIVNIRDLFLIKSLKHMMRYVLESGYSSQAVEVAHENINGDICWLSCTVMADIEDRRLQRLWLIIRDVTDSKAHIQHLEHQARHDSLTGLNNRIALREYLNEKLDQAKGFGFKCALILINLDRFKEINDALGHHYGDVLLKKIEPRLRILINQQRAFFARLGADEFALVIPAITSETQASILACDVVEKLKEPFDLGQLNVEISCSIGIAFSPNHGNDPSLLMRCADIAMYKAKKSNTRILSYEKEMDESSPRRLALMADMNKGLRNQEFFLVYQPKLDLINNEVKGAEALLRWQHPAFDLINPSEFIPLAEMSDVIIAMTHWVIDEALKQIKQWIVDGLYIKTSVNVSTRNLLDDDLIAFIGQKLDEHKVPASLLEIEITESSLMVDPERALNTLKQISDMGVSISVDDFGTGYSSFIYLRQLPISTLKIDIMFVQSMCHNHQDEVIVNSIINLAHNLSLTVVAEGAEDLKTMQRLKSMQCDMAQGYYVNKPVPSSEFARLHESWGRDSL